MRDWSLIRQVVLDLDGTLYRDGKIFPQTLPFLECLRRLGVGYTFLTNNTSRSKAEYVLKLKALGIDARGALLRHRAKAGGQNPPKFQKDILRSALVNERDVAARVERTLDVGPIPADQPDDRCSVRVGTLPKQAAQVVTVSIGRIHGKQNGMRRRVRHCLQRVGRVGRPCRVYTRAPQALAQQFARDGVDIHHEHSR